jgi:hypothetical protein
MSEGADGTIELIRKLSYRAARQRFGVPYEKWKAIKAGAVRDWRPYRGGGISKVDVQDVLDSVRSFPHWNTRTRAAKLGRRTEAVQAILAAKSLSRLVPRLKYAGFACDITQPLARARQHRVLAGGPGVYTNIDYKRLGAIRRLDPGDRSPSSVFVSGLQCVDAYTGFATVWCCEHQDDESAVDGFGHYLKEAPFKVHGLVLSDNGGCFVAPKFELYLASQGFIHRTTQYNHPWSNGKVEAFNRTLKYQAMPGLVAAGITDMPSVQQWLNKWCHWYNTERAHAGWINRGLPPLVVAKQWHGTPGDTFERLVALGNIKPDEVHRTRVMGSGKNAVDLGLTATQKGGAPFAFIIEAPTPKPPRNLALGWTIQK